MPKRSTFGQCVLTDVKMQLKYCKTQVFQRWSDWDIEKVSVLRIPNQATHRVMREVFLKANFKPYPGLLNQNAKGIW